MNYFVPDDQHSKVFDKERVQCGYVNVPAEYVTGYSLSDFKIAMMRESATGATKLGTLFINPGGPGESGVKELQWLDFPKEIRASYDIIGFDPRGVANSAPATGNQIKCDDQSDFATYWTGEDSASNDAEYLAHVDMIDAYYTKCSKDNPSWWTLNTTNVVDDLELMRKVLTGDQPLNFLGSSYGTTIAASYITRFPEHIGHITLDSPTTNEPTTDASAITQAKATEANVLRLVTGYAKAHDMSVDEVKSLMLKVRQEADDNQLLGFAGMTVVDSANETRQSSEYMFTHGIFALTYYDNATAQDYFNQGLESVSSAQKWNGLFEYFALQLDGYEPDSLRGPEFVGGNIKRNNSFEIMTIVDSMDIDFTNHKTIDERKALADKIKQAAPFWTSLNSDASNYQYVGDREGIDWNSIATTDSHIPDAPTVKPERTNTSGKPVLVVGAKFESTTPIEFAVKTALDLKSPLVTFNGTGHAPLAGFNHKCLNKIFVDYFVHDVLPAADVTCSS